MTAEEAHVKFTVRFSIYQQLRVPLMFARRWCLCLSSSLSSSFLSAGNAEMQDNDMLKICILQKLVAKKLSCKKKEERKRKETGLFPWKVMAKQFLCCRSLLKNYKYIPNKQQQKKRTRLGFHRFFRLMPETVRAQTGLLNHICRISCDVMNSELAGQLFTRGSKNNRCVRTEEIKILLLFMKIIKQQH